MKAAPTDGLTMTEAAVIIVVTVNTMAETAAIGMENDEAVIVGTTMMEVVDVANTMTAKETEGTVVVIAVLNEGGINSYWQYSEQKHQAGEGFVCNL